MDSQSRRSNNPIFTQTCSGRPEILTCPNCDRYVRMTDARCRVCRTKLAWWYLNFALLVIGGIAVALFLIYKLSE